MICVNCPRSDNSRVVRRGLQSPTATPAAVFIRSVVATRLAV